MKLKLSINMGGGRVEDITVNADAVATVGALAGAIAVADPRARGEVVADGLTLRIDGGPELSAAAELGSSGLQSGQRVLLTRAGGHSLVASSAGPRAATLMVTEGPDAGKDFPLRLGANQVGRGSGCDVRLTDPMVSKDHVRINVGEQIDIVDLASANGVLLRGSPISRAVLGSADEFVIGDSVLKVVQHATHTGTLMPSPVVLFNRQPRLDPLYEGIEFVAPEPPQAPSPGRLSMVSAIAPLVMAGLMYSITGNANSILLMALSPVLLVGSYFENKKNTKHRFEVGTARFKAGLRDLETQLHYAAEQEVKGRQLEYPSTAAIAESVTVRDALLWTRRPDRRSFLDVRLGEGAAATRHTVKVAETNNTLVELWDELHAVPRRYAYVAPVPTVADLAECGSLGIAGPAVVAKSVVNSVVLQLVALHSPAELVLCALAAHDRQAEWDWLKWLPHTSSEHSPLPVAHLVSSSTGPLVLALQQTMEDRERILAGSDSKVPGPRIVVLVDELADYDRPDVIDLLERGPSVGVHFVWVASSIAQVPAGCQVFMEWQQAHNSWSFGDVRTGGRTIPVAADVVSTEQVAALARRLSPVVDAGARVENVSSVPPRVAFLNVTDPDLASATSAVIGQWSLSRSLPEQLANPQRRGKREKKENNLRALVGATATDKFYLDLREHGPHALVGGTTGAGKSEFLQTWVLGMATAHSPARVNFLFVDYKGGAAFGECVRLPHCVGLVTDLSPYLVRRALISFRAELKYREELLAHRKAKDLLELERKEPAVAPPSLVIIVDEFAALAKEVPEFVDGVVDVAQRGRSLGIHLILATQRPAGVIRDNLRANTNLRVALRMADEADSDDVVGSRMAATFDPGLPGRGLAKMGPGRLTLFQAGYVGGWTTGEVPKASVAIESLAFDHGEKWKEPDDEDESQQQAPADPGPNDLKRIVSTVVDTATELQMPEARRPWQQELAATYELARLKVSRNDRELVIGILDDPSNQAQLPAVFFPDRDGNMAVFGTGGAGKTTVLRTIAVSAGLSTEGACHVYGIDFGSRGLSMLEALPHVGSIVNGDDHERIVRLLRMLKATADERSARYAGARTGSITEYRAATGNQAEPRIIVLVDGFGAFRQAYETGQRQVFLEMFQRLVADGRQLGIHFVITADRSNTIPATYGSSIQRRLVMRLAVDTEYSMFGVPSDAIAAESPPGRGYLDDFEIQIAVLGGSSGTARQSAAMQRLGADLAAAGRWEPAPKIGRLPETVRLEELPEDVGGDPSLGIAEDTLGPVGFAIDELFLLIGPPQAQRSRLTLAMLQSIERIRGPQRAALLGPRRSVLSGQFHWVASASGVDDVAVLCRELITKVEDGEIDVLVIENLTDFVSAPSDGPLQELLRMCLGHGVFVLADADSNQIGSAYGAANMFKSARNGFALQPEYGEGDSVFRTGFPRVTRTEFNSGAGFLVRQGRVVKVQTAAPFDA